MMPYGVLNLVITAVSNGFAPVWHQAIIWTNAGLLVNCAFRNKLVWNLIENMMIFHSRKSIKMMSAKFYVNSMKPELNDILKTILSNEFPSMNI